MSYKNILFVALSVVLVGCSQSASNYTFKSVHHEESRVSLSATLDSESDPAVSGGSLEEVRAVAKIVSISGNRCDWRIVVVNSTLQDVIVDVTVSCSGTNRAGKILDTGKKDKTVRVPSLRSVSIEDSTSFDKDYSGFVVDPKITKVTYTK